MSRGADTSSIADTLFRALCHQVPEKTVFLDIPEPNDQAKTLVKHYHMQPVFSTARMYTGQAPAIPLANIFGMTTFELG